MLLNLGGPAGDPEVRGFLRRLLSDPAVLPVPWPVRPWLARRIARRRAPLVTGHYRAIGGSPLDGETRAQVAALQEELGSGYRVTHLFRHSPPRAGPVLAGLAAAGVGRVIALPAYPHYSRSTTGSALADLSRAAGRRKMAMREIRSYPDAPGYIAALAELTGTPAEGTRLVFSAHGLPMRMVEQGDPYPQEIGRTVRALARALGRPEGCSLAYQSRMGKGEWTRPYLDQEIVRLGSQGVESVVVVPLSFTAENLETRYELDIELAGLAQRSGIGSFRRVPVPGRHPQFIRELAGLVRSRAQEAGWRTSGD